MKNRARILSAVLVLFFASFPFTSALAQGTAFTYQGRLNDGANPANGIYDLRFAIYDSSNSPGTLIAGPITDLATPVTNGLFTTTLDLGLTPFTGADRWLEIAVRTNGSSSFNTLNPRQKITPTPYAITAGNLADVVANNSVNSAGFATVSGGTGNVGAGFFSTIGGGAGNISGGSYATIGGGGLNETTDNGDTVAGGFSNTNSGYMATIGGGLHNFATAFYATLSGGTSNINTGLGSTISGGVQNTNNSDYTTIDGGFRNSIQTIATGAVIGGGTENNIGVLAGSGTISGGNNNTIETNAWSSTIGGGSGNTMHTNSAGSTISGGRGNTIQISTFDSAIGGGFDNSVGPYSEWDAIGGGFINTIQNSNFCSVIAGGGSNIIQNGASGSAIGGGSNNVIEVASSVIAGGFQNTAAGYLDSIGGGYQNMTFASAATIAGGSGNENFGDYGTVGGGSGNSVDGNSATVAGGAGNRVIADAATVGGGAGNTASGEGATVAGGEFQNTASGIDSTVSGGAGNTASLTGATVSGGGSNLATNYYSTVPGGSINVAGGAYSFAAGQQAHALHAGSFVWADSQNAVFASAASDTFNIRAQGGVHLNIDTSIFFGNQIRQMLNLWNTVYGIGVQSFTEYFRTDPNGTFSWFAGGVHSNNQNDPGGGTELMRLTATDLIVNTGIALNSTNGFSQSSVGNFSIDAPFKPGGRFIILTNGDVGISNSNPAHLLVVGSAISPAFCDGGAWVNSSDRNAKEGFSAINARDVLDKVSRLPITQWKYKTEAGGTRHLGPMAQDFHAAFGLNGADDTHISTVDEGGVALAAVQGLNEKLEASSGNLEARTGDAEGRIQKLEAENAELKARLERLERWLEQTQKSQ